MTAHRTLARHRLALVALPVATVVLLALAATAGPLVQQTEAGYTSAEQAALTAGAGTVQPAGTACTAASSAPHEIALTAPADGLAITGYRVTITVDPEPSGDYSWQTGTKNGIELLPIGDSYWPAAQAVVGWGIEMPMFAGDDFFGTVEVAAVGPGGWESSAVGYDWSIESDWGSIWVACTPTVA